MKTLSYLIMLLICGYGSAAQNHISIEPRQDGNGKWGLWVKDKAWIKPVYDTLVAAKYPFSNLPYFQGYIRKRDGKFGLAFYQLDDKEKHYQEHIVIPDTYEDICNTSLENILAVKEGGRYRFWHFYSWDREPVKADETWEDVRVLSYMTAVQKGGKWDFINRSNEKSNGLAFDSLALIDAGIQVWKNGKTGLYTLWEGYVRQRLEAKASAIRSLPGDEFEAVIDGTARRYNKDNKMVGLGADMQITSEQVLGYSVFTQNGKKGLLKDDGVTVLLPAEYASIETKIRDENGNVDGNHIMLETPDGARYLFDPSSGKKLAACKGCYYRIEQGNLFYTQEDGGERIYVDNNLERIAFPFKIVAAKSIDDTYYVMDPTGKWHPFYTPKAVADASKLVMNTQEGGGGTYYIEELADGKKRLVSLAGRTINAVYDEINPNYGWGLLTTSKGGKTDYYIVDKGTALQFTPKLAAGETLSSGYIHKGQGYIIYHKGDGAGVMKLSTGEKLEPQFSAADFRVIVVDGTKYTYDIADMPFDSYLHTKVKCEACKGKGKIVHTEKVTGAGTYVPGTSHTVSRPSLNNSVGIGYNGQAMQGYQTTTYTTPGYTTKGSTSYKETEELCRACNGKGKMEYKFRLEGTAYHLVKSR